MQQETKKYEFDSDGNEVSVYEHLNEWNAGVDIALTGCCTGPDFNIMIIDGVFHLSMNTDSFRVSIAIPRGEESFEKLREEVVKAEAWRIQKELRRKKEEKAKKAEGESSK